MSKSLFAVVAIVIFVVSVMVTTPKLVLAQADPVVEQEKETPAPESIELSKVEISDSAGELGFNTEKLESIDRKFQQLLKSEKIAGVSALITRKGKDVYFGQWGYQDKEKKIPLTRDAIFRIYSMTKPITSIAVMQLVEKGKLDLDEPVSKYLSEFSDLKVLETKSGNSKEVPPRRPMTTRDLLRHTSGLTYGFFGNTEVDQQYRKVGLLVTDINIKSTVKKLGKIPLQNHPGSKFHYSASTDVLGRLVEVISGKKLDDYFEHQIFKPLGMSDTCFSLPSEKQDRLSQLYANRKNKPLEPAAAMSSYRFLNESNAFFSGGGGLCSTVDDYCAFSQMLLNKGELNGERIVAAGTIDEMFKNQLVDIENPPGRQFKFGLGFRCFPKGDYGWGGAAGTKFWVNPEKELVVIYMIQMMPDEGRKYDNIVRDAAYSALRK